MSYVLKEANTVVQNLRNVFNYLMAAKKIGNGQALLSGELQTQIDVMQKNVNDFADKLGTVAENRSEDIRKYIQPL